MILHLGPVLLSPWNLLGTLLWKDMSIGVKSRGSVTCKSTYFGIARREVCDSSLWTCPAVTIESVGDITMERAEELFLGNISLLSFTEF